MKAALLVNPRAGSYREGKLNRLVAILEKIGVAVLWHRLEKGQSASEIVSELDHRMTPLIILAAGDGTINTALNALLQRNDYSQFNVAIVPIGTANVLSMELGVDSIEKSLKAIVGGKIKKLHMGRIIAIPEDRDNSRYFMLMASAGLDSKAVSGVNEELKKKIGGFAYLYEFFKILLKKNFRQLKVSVDSQL
ncbi:MAG: hypothetical protein LBB13_00950 [Rickettsiales bacterium]|nr:hypothetical protein [Rickettsiales bacterium]